MRHGCGKRAALGGGAGASPVRIDLDELKACMELGFDFNSPEMDQRLSDTFPVNGLYYDVNKQYNDAVSRTPPFNSPTRDGFWT